MKPSIIRLRALEKQLFAYRYALNTVDFDAETVAPEGSADGRAEACEVLSRASFELLVNADTAALLQQAAAEAEAARLAEYNSETARFARLRTERDRRLAETDYLLMADYPLSENQRTVLQVYRQALRDLPSQSVFGNLSFYSYKKACGQKKTVRGSKNSRRLSNGTPAI